MMGVIGQYDDEVLERRKRTIHLCEDATARISAWHGGAKVAEFGGWNSVARAISEAGTLAKSYGVTPSSSMRIRVEEKTEHYWKVLRGTDRWGHPEYEDGILRPRIVALRRHAWDDADGLIAPLWRPWTFHAEEWIGLKDEPPENSAVSACYAGLSVDVTDEGDLYRLFGVGLPVMTGVAVVSMAPPAFIRDQKERGVLSYLRVRVEGTCHVTAAPGTDDAAVAEFLSGLHVRAVSDRNGQATLDRLLRDHIRWIDPEREGSAWKPAVLALESAVA